MTDRALNEFLDAYDTHRVKDQQKYYSDREKEYVKADSQAGVLMAILLFLSGVSGVIAVTWSQHALWLGVVAATFAAAATMITAWADLIGFSKNAQIYRAAANRLALERPERPEASDADDDDVKAYIDTMEGILLGEVATWGKEWGSSGKGAPKPD